jgi:hypothetical protein
MNKPIVAFLMSSCLLSACANFGLKEQTQAYGGKFEGNRSSLSRCVVDKLQSDSRWLITGLQYETWTYPDIEATEVYGYSLNDVPGIFARNSPTNPDAVGTYPGMPIPKTHVYRKNSGAPADINPNYLFILTLKRTDAETVFATLNGKRYESNIVWEKLKACASGS